MADKSALDDVLRELWYNVEHPSAFAGKERLFQAVKQKLSDVTRKDVSNWLHKQKTYTVQKLSRKRFKRRRIISFGPNFCWELDLADLSSHSRQNGGVHFLLVCICVFSKFLIIKPLRNKKKSSVATALEEIFSNSEKTVPLYIRTDLGLFSSLCFALSRFPNVVIFSLFRFGIFQHRCGGNL